MTERYRRREKMRVTLTEIPSAVRSSIAPMPSLVAGTLMRQVRTGSSRLTQSRASATVGAAS